MPNSWVGTYVEEKMMYYGVDSEFQIQNVEGYNDICLDFIFSVDMAETFSTISGEILIMASCDGTYYKEIGSVGSHNFNNPILKRFSIHNNTYSYLKFVFKWFNGQGIIKAIGKYRKI